MQTKTVHDVKGIIYPFYLGVSYILACLMFLQLRFHWYTTKVRYVNSPYTSNYQNHILGVWHEDLTLFFITHRRFDHPNIWMTYPLWFMKPIHILKKWIGIKKLALGASGIDGKKALDEIIENLSEGWSSFVAPDGPAGPSKKIKDGILLMSQKAKVPIIPVHFHVDRQWRIPSWDRKRYPSLGAVVTVSYGPPIQVTDKNFEKAKDAISLFMDTGQPETLLVRSL